MRAVILALCLAVFAWLPAAPAFAQEAAPPKIEKRQLLVPKRNADGSLVTTAFSEDPLQWMRETQQEFYGRLSGALRRIRGEAYGTALWTLLSLSFAYGVFHAAGPGHGKAVISAWLLATENELKRGIFISFLSAIIQALSAIAIVTPLVLLGLAAGSLARSTAGVVESSSYAMIAALGLYLVWSALRVHPHKHSHAHHVHTADCGHAHVPEPRDLRRDWSLGRAAALAFSVGIRPCTGAILILLFAAPLGLYGTAVAAVFAMAAGTFLTVSAIAALSVYGKTIALKLAGGDGPWLGRLTAGLRLGGGAAIAVLGGLLFWASLGPGMGMT